MSQWMFRSRLPVLNSQFLVVVVAGTGAVVLASLFGVQRPQFAVVGLLISILLAVALESLFLLRARKDGSLLETPFNLSQDLEVFEQYRRAALAFERVSRRPDPIYRLAALERLGQIADQIDQVADGTIVYHGTETWRIVYDRLLRSPGLHTYRSIAWAKNDNYWQDEPGRQSLKVNFELHEAGRLHIERIVILADELWPSDEPLPTERLRYWIHEQVTNGIVIKVVRQAAVAGEPELLQDVGIYGSRAVGTQELDEQCRTVRFVLTFNFGEVIKAEERWNLLSVYAVSYQDLLDHFTLDD